MALETPSRPRSWIRPARRTVRTSWSGSPQPRGGRGGEVRDAAGMAGELRRLEIGEIGHRLESARPACRLRPTGPGRARRREWPTIQTPRRDRPAPARGVRRRWRRCPGRTHRRTVGSRSGRPGFRAAGRRPRPGRTAGPAGPAARCRCRGGPAVRPCRPIARRTARNDATATSPSSSCSAKSATSRAWVDRKTITSFRPEIGSRANRRARSGQLPCEPTRRSRYAATCAGCSSQQVEPLGLELDVVAEPAGLFGRVGVAVGVDHQALVVGRLPLRLTGADQVGQAERDHGLTDAVRHRLAEPEVGRVREGRHQFRDADAVSAVALHRIRRPPCCEPTLDHPPAGRTKMG